MNKLVHIQQELTMGTNLEFFLMPLIFDLMKIQSKILHIDHFLLLC
jgi:hypothetical protein